MDVQLFHLPTQVALGRVSRSKIWLVVLWRIAGNPCCAQPVRSPAAVC